MNQASPLTHLKVWQLTAPIILSNASVPLVGIVDTAVLGQNPDPSYLVGVGYGAATIAITLFLFGFLRVVTGGYAAQLFGSKDWPELKVLFYRSMILASLFGLLSLLLSWPIIAGARWFFEDSQTTEDAMSLYLLIRLIGAPIILANMVAVAMLIGMQRTGLIFTLQIVLNGLNIGLDLLFVLGLGWGVAGVAFASIFAEAIALGLGIWLVRSSLPSEHAALPKIFDWPKIRQLLSANKNMFIRNLALESAYLLQLKLLGLGGTVAAGAALLHLHYIQFTAYAMDGFAITVETLSGSAIGKRSKSELREVISKTSLWAGLLAALFTLAYWGIGPSYFAIMTKSPEVIESAIQTLWVVAPMTLVGVWAFLADGLFFGATRAIELRNATLASTLIFAAACWIAFPFGAFGLWLAFGLFMIARTLFLVLYYTRIEASLEPALPRTI